jgi:hypothetical protein
VVLPRANVGRFIQNQVEGVLLDEGNALDIAEKLGILLKDRDLGQRIGRAGREFALRNLDWARNVPPIKEFYQEVLRPGRIQHAGIGAEEGARRLPGRFAARPVSGESHGVPQSGPRETGLPIKLIAFYLPQFHQIPENDEWWGKGFTEWTNVVQARPNFVGHYQPQLPADLGFYDLRLPESMQQQVQLARTYGIYGFCFHYYWFSGRRVLERPLTQMLESGKPDLPFCISWANENWSRRWDGSDDEVLLRQEYSDDTDERFIRDVLGILKDPRYIRVGGAPLLLVYRVDLLPDATRTARHWRSVCAREGLPSIHLAAVQSFGIGDPRPYGFDSAVEFPPHVKRALLDVRTMPGVYPDFDGYLEDYLAIVRHQVRQPPTDYVTYRGVMPAWDNTPRRGTHAHIVIKSSPSAYEGWLRFAVEHSLARAKVQEPLIFVNAWNEWAEGAYLEPDQRRGHAYLEATRRALCVGVASHYRRHGLKIDERLVRRVLDPRADDDEATSATRGLSAVEETATPPVSHGPQRRLPRRPRGSTTPR